MRCSLWELCCWRWKLRTAAARSREEDVVEGDGLLVLVKRENDSLKCGNTNNGGRGVMRGTRSSCKRELLIEP